MSLLDRTNATVTVFPEVVVADADGNTITRAASTGVVTEARVWPISYRGSGFPESNDGGFISSTRYGVRFPRSFTTVVGAQAKVEWDGNVYSIVGDPVVFNGSPRTRHAHYVMERS